MLRRSSSAFSHFLKGMGRALDLGGTLSGPKTAFSAAEEDRLALYGDWQAVGDDMRSAIHCKESLKYGQ